MEKGWYVVTKDGTRVAGPFQMPDAALMRLATVPTAHVERQEIGRSVRGE